MKSELTTRGPLSVTQCTGPLSVKANKWSVIGSSTENNLLESRQTEPYTVTDVGMDFDGVSYHKRCCNRIGNGFNRLWHSRSHLRTTHNDLRHGHTSIPSTTTRCPRNRTFSSRWMSSLTRCQTVSLLILGVRHRKVQGGVLRGSQTWKRRRDPSNERTPDPTGVSIGIPRSSRERDTKVLIESFPLGVVP